MSEIKSIPSAWAYDHTGNRLTLQPIAVGYEVEWKRRGVRGAYRARVLTIEPTRIQIKLTRYSDNPRADLSESKPRWVKPEFIHIYPYCAGFDGTCKNTPTASGYCISCERDQEAEYESRHPW